MAAGTQSQAGWDSLVADCPADLPFLLSLAEAESRPAETGVVMDWAGLLGGLPSQKSSGLDGANALVIFKLGMEDVPADLMEKAVRIAAKTCTFRPSPAELRALIADDLAERSLRLARLRKAVGVAR